MTAVPSQQELNNLAAACQRVWELDVNALQPDRDYQLNPQVSYAWLVTLYKFFLGAQLSSDCIQHGKKSYMEQDVAPGPLFSQVSPAVFQQRSTYALFYALLDNYHA